jgi:pimeloyl-ACP methyl ester carboxylesterase
MGRVRMPAGSVLPKDIVPASSLAFQGLRSTHRRDGFGAELVAVMSDDPVATLRPPGGTPEGEAGGDGDADALAGRGERRRPQRRKPPAWSEMPSPTLTVLFRFRGDDLASVLATREVHLSVHDPYIDSEVTLHGQRVPLAANFTAGYGLWLAQSGFATQSLRTLFGREQGIDHPHLYMMQPWDPDRRIILMLHGLASSPEAWVNVANEVLGDEALREHYQVWQVYYPTNLPIALNHSAIRRLATDALRHFDPAGTATASRDMVLVGHSMGGVIARLMVSRADDQLWDAMIARYDPDPARLARVRPRLEPMLRFAPLPSVSRAIFIAAPHRGTLAAGNRLGRWISGLVRLPLTILEGFDDVLQALAGSTAGATDGEPARLPNSIDNLSHEDPFVQASGSLPISPHVGYHSIIAQRSPTIALADSDDGLVPYTSAHLDGALSEKVIVSGHSVQETAPAILEIRRILHEDLRAHEARRIATP